MPAESSEARGPRTKLEGLKEIRAHLGGWDAKTIKKRADEDGLPLRVLTNVGKKPRYIAYAEELDAWLADRPRADSPATGSDLQPSSPSPLRSGRRHRTAAIFTSAGVVGVLGILAIAVGLANGQPDFPELIAIEPWGVRAVRNGEILWERQDLWIEGVQRARIPQRKHPVLAAVRFLSPAHLDKTRALYFLDPETGDPLEGVDAVVLPTASDFFPGYSELYNAEINVLDLDQDGIDEQLITYVHQPNYPAFTVLYEPRVDRHRLLYFSSGHHRFVGAADLDGSAGLELLFEETNNLMGWYSGVAAIRLAPAIGEPGMKPPPAFSPNMTASLDPWTTLLWYALTPPSRCLLPQDCLVEAPQGGVLTLQRSDPVHFDYDGFDPAYGSPLSSVDREKGRREVYQTLFHLARPAELSTEAARLESSLRATELAGQLGTPWLYEWTQRQHVIELVRAGQIDRALVAADRLQNDHPEVAGLAAFDIAEALHLAGEVERAVPFYERALGPGGPAFGFGRAPEEHYRGLVFALVELGRIEEALSRARSCADLVPVGWPEALSAFVLWRDGRPAELKANGDAMHQADLLRYWSLELELTNDSAPAKILLRLESEQELGSETEPMLMSLEAALLASVGREEEARERIEAAYARALVDAKVRVSIRAHLPVIRARCEALGACSPIS